MRQGDPLSLSLFIIMSEPFSKIIKSKHGQGFWRGAHIEGASVLVTHSLFVDDTLLFGKSNV